MADTHPETKSSSRLRFTRSKNPKPMRVTSRVVDILGYLARFRFLTSRQIQMLDGGSEQQVLRLLLAMYRHGYVERPRAQIAKLAHFYDEGNVPLIYAITRKGARLAAERGLNGLDRVDWTTKNDRAHADFIAHTVDTAEVMIAFELALEPGIGQLVDHHALLPYFPEATRVHRDPFALDITAPIEGHGMTKIAIIPDRVFSIILPDNTRLNFPLELDRGTMPVVASQLVGRSSYIRKLYGYWHAWKQDRHTEKWGFKRFRPLTVTTSDARIASMIEAQQKVVGTQGSNMFLFTTLDRLRSHSPLDPIWISGKGETVSLLATE